MSKLLATALKADIGIDGTDRGVFASLTANSIITVIAADTYQPIVGTFSNMPLESFEGTATPSLKYTDTDTKYFEIDWHTSLTVDAVGKLVHCAVYHKPSGGSFALVDGSIMGTYIKVKAEPQAFSGTCVVELAQNDEIQLVFKSETIGDDVTFKHYVTSINQFYLT
jgi:hypothetical protein